jgi:anti-sigma factor RsiW
VKADDTNLSETLWACLHGELDPNAQKAFELEMAGDPGLRARFESARRLDHLLRKTLPALGTADDLAVEAMAAQALEAWEREHPADSKNVAEVTKIAPWHLFRKKAVFGVSGLAAAAALILLVSPALRSAEGVRWTDPVAAPLTLRGSGNVNERSAQVPARAAAQCQEALSAALAKALEARGAAVPRTTLSLRFQELRHGGAFSVVITAARRDGQTVGEWSGDYSGMETFLSHADASAARIAEALSPSGSPGSKEGQP